MQAKILCVGTELLLGDVLDTNSKMIAEYCRAHGIDIVEMRTVGDNEKRIARAFSEMLPAELLIVTGGMRQCGGDGCGRGRDGHGRDAGDGARCGEYCPDEYHGARLRQRGGTRGISVRSEKRLGRGERLYDGGSRARGDQTARAVRRGR